MSDAAGVAFLAPGGLALFVKRLAEAADHQSEWCFPGGSSEGDETDEQTARREALEETGLEPGTLIEVATTPIDEGGYFTTFAARVPEPLPVTLDDESVGYAWAPLTSPPQPLHPGTAAVLSLGFGEDTAGDAALHDEEPIYCAEDSISIPEGLMAFDRAMGGEGRPPRLALAFDYASERSYDKDGRLHVGTTNISKANICPYRGDEIPGCEELGLDPRKTYQLLRDPDELEKAAASFNRLPLLSKHVPVTIADHQPHLVIGATGSDAAFEAPFLKNSLTIWARDALDDVESEVKKELSSAYHYRADMTPGTYQGVPYDGVMRDIVGNHVALVKEGRAGADVVVGDEAIPIDHQEYTEMANQRPQITVRSAMLTGAISAFLLPRLAADSKVNFGGALDGLTKANFKGRKAAIITAVKAATAGKLAKDASIDGVAQLLDMIEAHEPSGIDADPKPQETIEGSLEKEDPEEKPYVPDALPEFLKGKLNAEDYKAAMDMHAKSAKDAAEPPPFAGKPETGAEDEDEEDKEDKEEKVDKKAMDAAIRIAVDAANKNQRDLREAERFVRPWVGDLKIACDSAEAVHRAALDVLGIEHKEIHKSALPTIIGMQPKPGDKKPASAPAIGMDEKQAADFATRFPDVGRIGLMG